MLRAGRLDERLVELEVSQRAAPVVEIFSAAGMEEMDFNFKDMLGNLFPGKTKQRKVKLAEAREYLLQEEAGRLIDMDRVVEEARRKVEQNGIIFLDEIDKIVGRDGSPGARRLPGRGAAGPAAHRRGHHREQQVRHAAHRPHPVHRLRGLSPVQAVGPDPGDAGPLPHPGGAPLPGGRRSSYAS